MAQDATTSGEPAPSDPTAPSDPEQPTGSAPSAGGSPKNRRRTWLLAALLLVVVTVVAVNWADNNCGLPGQDQVCTRVLFLGNSYTSVNDLPGTFASLARSGGHLVATQQLTTGGWTLADHAGSPATAKLLAAVPWDTVVLQEQSVIPSDRQASTTQMLPAARTLIGSIRSAGAEPMLFLTWARRDGLAQDGMPDFASMQRALDTGYLTVATDQHAPVAPVGQAWATAVDRGMGSKLWATDGSHPATAGTYLAACVFYVSLFGTSPVGLDYRDGLSEETATGLQRIADETVEDHRRRWGL